MLMGTFTKSEYGSNQLTSGWPCIYMYSTKIIVMVTDKYKKMGEETGMVLFLHVGKAGGKTNTKEGQKG